MSRTTWVTLYWLVGWFAIGFGVPETLAIITKHREWTFSDTVWRICETMPGQTIWQYTLIHVIIGLALLAVFVHLVFGVFP